MGEDFEQARVLVALLVSIIFLSLHFAVRPLKQCVAQPFTCISPFQPIFPRVLSTLNVLRINSPEDGALMIMVELALILIYTCVLLIKTCSKSAELCSTFGFGDTANGVYVFFVFLGLSLLLLQLTFGAWKLWTIGYVPKILLVAKSHSVAPSMIFKHVLYRRCVRKDRLPDAFVLATLPFSTQAPNALAGVETSSDRLPACSALILHT